MKSCETFEHFKALLVFKEPGGLQSLGSQKNLIQLTETTTKEQTMNI